MYKSGTMMIMVCESPLHAGTGSDLDFIDKPIQRERHTQFPKIEGSSLKGALRERLAGVHEDRNGHEDMISAFGPFEPGAGAEKQGALGFSDARLLLFPVKSMKGVFAWVTCPRVLRRFEEDMRRLPGNEAFKINSVREPKSGSCYVFTDTLRIAGTNKEGKKTKSIVLEEFDFKSFIPGEGKLCTVGETPLNEWLAKAIYPGEGGTDGNYWHDHLRDCLVILPDDDFSDFVNFTTEVITRNQINPETGTVKTGHLFTEEYLPSDSVLYSLVMAHEEFKKVDESKGETRQSSDDILEIFTNSMKSECKMAFQAGGNASIGKGLIRAEFITPNT